VVLTADGFDAAATDELRVTVRRERLAAAGAERDPKPLAGAAPGGQRIGEAIAVDEPGRAFGCAHCGERLGTFDTHALEHALVHARPIPELGERFTDPAIFIDDEVQWRELYCPGCATLLGAEVARVEDPILHDAELAL
jgi:N-methylhydantoinase B